MNEPNSTPTQAPISEYQVRWFLRRIKFSIWFPVVIVSAFAAGYLFWQKTLILGPYDLEPVNIIRNNNSNLPRDEVLRGWQTYRNEKYGFEVNFPSQFIRTLLPYDVGFFASDSYTYLQLTIGDPDLAAHYYQPNQKISCIYHYFNGWTPYERDLKTRTWNINVYNTNKSDCPQENITTNKIIFYDTPINIDPSNFIFDDPPFNNGNLKRFRAFIPDVNNNKKIVDIIMDTNKDFEESKKIWKQILDSFKFINQQQQTSSSPQPTVCVQVITPAKNQQTGEIRDFPTPCDVPEGWAVVR